MLLNNRIIWSDNGVLKDLSVTLSDFYSPAYVIPFIAAQDALYFGSDMPFNHRFFDVSVVNLLASVPTIKIWDGDSFSSAVDVLDQTQNTSGTTFGKSEIISWVTDRNKVWQREDTTESISELSTLKIYKMYWAKMTFSGDFTGTFALNYVGHKFCDDDQLYGHYPELSITDFKTAYKAGKTDWEEQEIIASETIIRDLRAKRELWSPNQILEWERFQEACVHKTAEIVFSAGGQEYEDDRNRARAYYKEALNTQRGGIDKDGDGRLEPQEQYTTSGFRRR